MEDSPSSSTATREHWTLLLGRWPLETRSSLGLGPSLETWTGWVAVEQMGKMRGPFGSRLCTVLGIGTPDRNDDPGPRDASRLLRPFCFLLFAHDLRSCERASITQDQIVIVVRSVSVSEIQFLYQMAGSIDRKMTSSLNLSSILQSIATFMGYDSLCGKYTHTIQPNDAGQNTRMHPRSTIMQLFLASPVQTHFHPTCQTPLDKSPHPQPHPHLHVQTCISIAHTNRQQHPSQRGPPQPPCPATKREPTTQPPNNSTLSTRQCSERREYHTRMRSRNVASPMKRTVGGAESKSWSCTVRWPRPSAGSRYADASVGGCWSVI